MTNGGRVLGVTAKGKDLKEARANAYAATEWVKFDNKYMRHDIGKAIDEATTKPEFRDSPTEKEKCFARHFRRTTAAEEFAENNGKTGNLTI